MKRPTGDYWDDTSHHDFTITVHEEPELEGYRSKLLDPNGNHIIYSMPSTRMPFIGFVCPPSIQEDYEDFLDQLDEE